jgi:ABC-type sugar transport system ATPase subunit
MNPIKLEVRHLSRRYPGTMALDDCSAIWHGGNVHALLGKHGSGRSTLAKCLCGAVPPTGGELFLNDRKLDLRSPMDALKAGIALVYQELSLVPDFTVAENIFMGRTFRKGPAGIFIDWKRTYAKAAEILEALRLEVPVTAKVSSLGAGQRQMIEIAKALSCDPSVLILDEATSALAPGEAESLFRVVRRFREQGRIVLFITHRRNEIRAVADQVTVIRDGRCAGSLPAAEAEPGILVELMYGDTRALPGQDRPPAAGEVVLAVHGLTRNERFADVSFCLRRGEILGLAGRLGSGRSQLLRSIFGVEPLDAGTILLQDRAITRPQIPDMMRLGLALAPGNRKDEGAAPSRSIADTFSLASLSAIASLGGGNDRRQAPVALPWIQALQRKLDGAGHPVSPRIAGDWLDSEPSILFIDEPGRGLDLQERQQFYRILWDLSRRGLSAILVSTDLKELMEACHRILVMDRGRITAETSPGQISLDELYALCLEGGYRSI